MSLWICLLLSLSLSLTLSQPLSTPAWADERCPDLTADDVHHFDIRVTRSKIPVKKTHYVCQQFEIPSDEEYHVVAFEPLINNTQVMHHMLLFSCIYNTKPSGPHSCGSFDVTFCPAWQTVWTVGLREDLTCSHPDAGLKFGLNNVNTMSLQIHWSNAELRQNIYDNSGIRIHYTRTLRSYDAGNVQIGQDNLFIPPQHALSQHSGSCSSKCTRLSLPHPIYLTRTYLHMHHLGVKASLEQYRKGRLVRTLVIDDTYQYEKPPIHYHEPEVRILPGDEVKMNCWFDTLNGDHSRNHTIYFGEGSDAEMCYAFISYFPKVPNFNRCVQLGTADTCDSDGVIEECDFTQFLSNVTFQVFPAILKACKVDVCGTDKCGELIRQLTKSPCMNGNISVYVRNIYLSKMDMWRRVKEVIGRYRGCTGSPLTWKPAV